MSETDALPPAPRRVRVLVAAQTQREQLHMNKIQCAELPFDRSLVYHSFRVEFVEDFFCPCILSRIVSALVCSIERTLLKKRVVMNDSNITSINNRPIFRGTKGEVGVAVYVSESWVK